MSFRLTLLNYPSRLVLSNKKRDKIILPSAF